MDTNVSLSNDVKCNIKRLEDNVSEGRIELASCICLVGLSWVNGIALLGWRMATSR